MKDFVKIIIKDQDGKILEHYYLRTGVWDVPAGKIEDGENPKQAAVRELLERTGFKIMETNLKESIPEGEFLVFNGKKEFLVKEANPGEQGNYSTKIRWK